MWFTSRKIRQLDGQEGLHSNRFMHDHSLLALVLSNISHEVRNGHVLLKAPVLHTSVLMHLSPGSGFRTSEGTALPNLRLPAARSSIHERFPCLGNDGHSHCILISRTGFLVGLKGHTRTNTAAQTSNSYQIALAPARNERQNAT